MKMDLKSRFKNPTYIIQLIVTILASIILPILAYNKIELSSITSWRILLDLFISTISNPYLLVLVGISVLNATIDPRSKGLGDNLKVTEVLDYEDISNDSSLE